MNDPVVVTELDEKVSKIKKADVFSEKAKMKLKFNYTAERNDFEYNVFGNNMPYINTPKVRKIVGRGIQKVNDSLSPPENMYLAGLSKGQVATQFEISGGNEAEVVKSLSKVGKDITENSDQTLDFTVSHIKDAKIHKKFTFDKKFEGDHCLIINSRTGLGQRLSNTPYANDHAECVLIAHPVHQAKEAMKYTEPIDANYNTKIIKLFDGWKDQIFTALDSSTSSFNTLKRQTKAETNLIQTKGSDLYP